MAASLIAKKYVSLLLLGAIAVGVGTSAYIISTQSFQYKSGASNVVQTATGVLVKKGTSAFSPCKNAATPYALLGAQPETRLNAQRSPVPSGKPTVRPTPACTSLTVQSSLADPLIGKRVIATGTSQNGIFYATDLKLTSGK